MTVKDFLEVVIKGEFTKNDILKFAKECEDRQDLCKEMRFKAYAIENAIGAEIVGYTDNSKPLYKRDYYTYLGANFKDAVNRLEVAIEAIENMNITASSTKEVNSFASTAKEEMNKLPTIIGTEQEKKVFARAIKKGYMVLNENSYKWALTKSLCAYMCGRLYCGDRIKEDEIDYSRDLNKGRRRLPRKELKKLFGFDVGANRGTMKEPPRNVYMIEELFENGGRP